MTIMVILLVGLGIALAYRLLHWLLRPLTRRQLWQRASYLLAGAEFLTWIVWLFWLTRQIFINRDVYVYFSMGVGLLLFGALTWFVLRDVLAGIIFKLQHNLKPQQAIQVSKHAGRLLRLGTTTITIESNTGEHLKIPYTQLINQTVGHNESSHVVEPFDFTLEVPKSSSKDQWMRTLRREVLLLPWASARRKPVIQWQREDDACHLFEVRVHSLSAQHAQLIENHLRHMHVVSEA